MYSEEGSEAWRAVRGGVGHGVGGGVGGRGLWGAIEHFPPLTMTNQIIETAISERADNDNLVQAMAIYGTTYGTTCPGIHLIYVCAKS